jgi:hypothetical protein
MNLRRILAGALLALGLTAAATAHEVIYVASLTGPAEAPSNASPGIGTARVTFDLDLVTMRVEASFSGLLGNTTASHIHCCTLIAGVSTIGVATQTPTFAGFPLGVTSGTYNHVFDMTLASSYNAPFITNNGGTVSGAFNALLAGLDTGKAYFNVHTSVFQGGEIRGFLAPVPEPASQAMLALGLLALSIVARRRRRT